MVVVYKSRLNACYLREQENFRANCKKQVTDYWNAFQAWKKKGITMTLFRI